jgi:hypothetical protein
MSNNQHEALGDSELTEGLLEINAQEVIADFGGHTDFSFRKLLAETGGAMNLMFSYSVISGKGFTYFLPSIDDYARSPESELDCELPGSFAHAVKNQLRINPVAVLAVQDQVESLSKYLLDHLGKFDQGEEWESVTAEDLRIILEIVRQNKSAEQTAS